MAGNRTIACIGPSYMLADRKAAVQRAVNLHMTQIEGLGEDKQVILRSIPGLALLVTMGGDITGTYNADGRWFVVAGGNLYEMQSNGTATFRGAIGSAEHFVSMKHGRSQLVLVYGAQGYVFDLNTNALSPIASSAWRGSLWVEELDGYFVFVDPFTAQDQFYISSIDDALSLSALDFSSADAQPDDIVTHRVRKRELIIFGTRSIEIWIDSGDSDFPFVRYNATPIDVGVVGYRAAAIASDTVCWVGQTDRGAGYVYMMQGHQPVRISTQAVEEALSSSTDLSSASMWSYHVEGNEFIGINAPGMQTTWVYDFSVGQWHERGEWVNGAWAAWRPDQITFYEGSHYATSGKKIYHLDANTYTNDGDPLVRERTWPHLMAPSFEPVAYRGLELGCTTGSGGNITLEISNDGGYTFGAPLPLLLGTVGRFMERIRWLMLGAARDRVFRLRCSDAVPLAIHSAAVDA